MNKKETIQLIVASSNTHKIQEIHQILPYISFSSISDIQQAHNIPDTADFFTPPEETGNTFFENAMIKAQYYYRTLQVYYKNTEKQSFKNIAVVAEDSGISIDALGGAPGIFSARYGKDKVSKEIQQRNAQWQLDYVLKHMEKKTQRSAYFTCSVVVLFSDNNFISSQATWHGSIIDTPSYTLQNGFGYDPIFYLHEQQCTSAMLSPQEKNILSHRAKAFTQLAPLFYSLNLIQ